MQTLLVIDMQNAWINEHPRHDLQAVIARINQVAAQCRQRGQAVIFIRHSNESASIGSPEFQVHGDLVIESKDIFIDKTACDSFSDTHLLAQLQELKTTSVIICGLATEFCVDTTLHASLFQGFDVIALADAHTTGNRGHLDALSIITHHNWVWANLAVPSGRKMTVTTCAELFPA